MQEVINTHRESNIITSKNGGMAVREIQKNMLEFYQYHLKDQQSLKQEPIHYDIIFLDLNMPIMDGYEACKRIIQIY